MSKLPHKPTKEFDMAKFKAKVGDALRECFHGEGGHSKKHKTGQSIQKRGSMIGEKIRNNDQKRPFWIMLNLVLGGNSPSQKLYPIR